MGISIRLKELIEEIVRLKEISSLVEVAHEMKLQLPRDWLALHQYQ